MASEAQQRKRIRRKKRIKSGKVRKRRLRSHGSTPPFKIHQEKPEQKPSKPDTVDEKPTKQPSKPGTADKKPVKEKTTKPDIADKKPTKKKAPKSDTTVKKPAKAKPVKKAADTK